MQVDAKIIWPKHGPNMVPIIILLDYLDSLMFLSDNLSSFNEVESYIQYILSEMPLI